MAILQDLWQHSYEVGKLEQAKGYAADMDSLVEASTDAKARFTYYNKKGKEARRRGEHKIAEQWFVKGMEMAERESRETISADRYLSYTNLRDLYAATGLYDEALVYARRALDEHQRITPAGNYRYYLPYMAIAEIYKLKGEKERCFVCIDSLFLRAPQMEEPKELCLLYMVKAGCHTVFNEYSAALAEYRKADELLAARYPKSDANRVPLLALMGGLEHKLGKFAESERLYGLYAEQMA